ncbi:hypothetical protein FOZ62_007453, partial [Perkinsus olseni]
VSADEVASKAFQCDGSTYRPDLISSGYSLLSWGQEYCENFQRMQSAQSCTARDVEILRYSSLRCETFLLTGSLPCECFDDLGGILQEDRATLESCDSFREAMTLKGMKNLEERAAVRRNLGTAEHRTAWESVRARCDAKGGLQRLAAAESLISQTERNPVKKMMSRLLLGGDLTGLKEDPEALAGFEEGFKAALLELLGRESMDKDSIVMNGIVMVESAAVTATTPSPTTAVIEPRITTTSTTPSPRVLQSSGASSSAVNFELTVESGTTTGTLAEREAAAAAEAAAVAESFESLNSDASKQTTLLNSLSASVPNLPPMSFLGLADPQVRDVIEQLCLSPKFKCPITGTCIDERFVCNQISECEVIEPGETVAADERNCVFTTPAPGAVCKETQFKCGSGECIEDVFYCDEVRDCADGSDETQP